MSDSKQLNIRVNLDTGKLERDAASATNTLRGIGNEAETQGKRLTGVFKNVGAGIAAAFAAQQIKSFIGEIIKVRSEIQSLSVSFETLLGSKEKADELFGKIRKFATSTPMQMNDLAQGAQTMLGFNIEAKKVMPMLQAIGDISMGDAQKFNSLTLAFSQMSATGKLMGQDLLQMINAGFNPLAVISEKTGKSISTLKEEMSAGSISAKQIEQAFIDATSEGGKFHGMLEKQSHTLKGSLSNLQGAFADMLNDIGESSEGLLAGGITMAYEAVKNYKDVGEAVLALIATYGVYKAAVIANTALEAAALDALHAKVAAIGQVATAQATGIELEVQQAVASGQLTAAQGEEILAAYALAEARVAELQALAAQLKLEKESAIATQATAAAKVQAAEEQVIAANMKYEAALRSGNGEKIERAELALGTAQSELNAASKAHQAAMTATATASKKADAAATAANTAQQELNTLSTETNTKATGFLTLAKNGLRNAVAKLYATMTAHPFAMLAAAVVALGYAIYKLITYETDAEKIAKSINKGSAELQSQYAREKQKLDDLNDTLKKSKKGSEEWKTAKERIISQYGTYFKGLEQEIDKVGDLSTAYDTLTKNIRKSMLARKIDAYYQENEPDFSDLLQDIRKDLTNGVTMPNYKGSGKEGKFIDFKLTNEAANQWMDAINRYILGEDVNFSHAAQQFLNWKGGALAHNLYMNRMRKARGQWNTFHEGLYDLGGAFGFSDAEVNAVLNGENGENEEDNGLPEVHNKEYWEKYKKQQETELAALADTELNTQRAIQLRKNIAAADKKLKGYSVNSSGGGSNKTPDEIAADRAAATQQQNDLEIQQLNERRAAILSYDAELEQARIDIITDAAEKRRRQRELDYKNELADMQRQMEQEVQAEVQRQKAIFDAQEESNAAGKKNYAKKTFKSGQTLALSLEPGVSIANDANTGDVKTANINAILARYGVLYHLLAAKHKKSLDDQAQADQLAMAEYLQQYGTFEEKKTAIAAIYAAKRAKATTDAEQMELAMQESKALNDLEFDDFMTNRAALAFGEIDNLSRSTIARLIIEMEKYRDKVMQTFDPEKIEKFNQALSNLKRAQALSAGGLFTPAFFKERAAAQAEINAAEQTHNDLLEAKIRKENEVKKKIEEIIAKVKELTGQDVTAEQVTDGSTITNIIGQLGASGNKQEAADLSSLIGGLNGARVELGQVTNASNTATASLDQLKEAFSAKFTGQGGALSMVDTIVHGINDIVQGTNETVKELASTADALGADTSVGSGWDKAQTFMQGFADASAGATEAFNSLKSGNIMGVVSGVTKSFTSWIKAFAAIHDASLERTIQSLQDEIDELERMNRRIENRLKGEYSKQANKSYNEEIRNLEKQRQLIQKQIAAEEDKKNTDDDRIKEWEDQYEELGWQIEEYKDKALDAILGEDISSSIDNFTDKLAESWGKTGERARAAKDYVKTILRQMVLEAMKTDLTEPIRKLREMMTKALDDDVVTEIEQAEMEQFAQQLADETERKYKWADRIMNDGASDSGSGTTGTFATASQDSITELSGRAAAIHTSGEMRRELLLNIGIDVAALRAELAASTESTAEMRELQLIAVGHLETIARNTNELYEMNERLDKIERNTRGL